LAADFLDFFCCVDKPEKESGNLSKFASHQFLLHLPILKHLYLENKSQHILTTSSNLLGFCLIVLTSLKISKVNERSIIDELTGVACIFLTLSSISSFLSLRTRKEKLSGVYEKIADIIFLITLLFISFITIAIAFSFIF